MTAQYGKWTEPKRTNLTENETFPYRVDEELNGQAVRDMSM